MGTPFSAPGAGSPTGPRAVGETKPGTRRFYIKRFDTLRAQRDPVLQYWLDITDFLAPRKGRFRSILADLGTPKRNDYNLLNNTGTSALEALRALLVTGITPPARNWLRFKLKDRELAAMAENKEWVDMAEKAFFSIINASNFHSIMPSVYEEVAMYGTAALELVRHPDKLVSFRLMTAGQYVIGTDIFGTVNTFFYEDVMTVEQMYEEFVVPAEDRDAAEMKLSQKVRECWRKGEVDERFTVIKGIFPNDTPKDARLDAMDPRANVNFPFKGVAFQPDEPGSPDGSKEELLRVDYYKHMPVLVPRWHVNPGEPYGTGPGMTALGDIKMLQEMERSKMTIIEKLAHPPLISNTDSIEGKINQNAGSITYLPMMSGPVTDMVRPLVDMRTNAAELGNEIYRVEQRIRMAFHGNLVRNIEELRPPAGTPGSSRNITATEVDAREREKLLQLAPVMERFDYDMLDPMVTILMDWMIENGIIPPLPPEMEGAEMDIEFLNIVSAAQRSAAAQGTIDLIAYVTNPELSQHPVFDKLAIKVKLGEAIEQIAEGMDVPAHVMLALNDFKESIAEMQRQEAEQAKMEQMQQMTESMKNLGQVPGTDGKPATQNIADAVYKDDPNGSQ